MCAYCRALNYQHPSRYFRPDCGRVIRARVNPFTGEDIPVDLWVNEIAPEDWDWYERHWMDMDEFDYRVRCELRLP